MNQNAESEDDYFFTVAVYGSSLWELLMVVIYGSRRIFNAASTEPIGLAKVVPPPPANRSPTGRTPLAQCQINEPESPPAEKGLAFTDWIAI